MIRPFSLLEHVLVLALLAFSTANAVQFQASNNAKGTAGGNRFDQEIGVSYTTQVMSTSSNFIWNTFNQQPADRENIDLVTLVVESMDGVAYTSNNGIHVSASYIAGYSGNVKTEFVGVLYHEMTHVWQWNGQGNAPGGLIEGTYL
jgi:Peptidase of plants and bacteria